MPEPRGGGRQPAGNQPAATPQKVATCRNLHEATPEAFADHLKICPECCTDAQRAFNALKSASTKSEADTASGSDPVTNFLSSVRKGFLGN